MNTVSTERFPDLVTFGPAAVQTRQYIHPGIYSQFVKYLLAIHNNYKTKNSQRRFEFTNHKNLITNIHMKAAF
jgi:hypothetical protein